MKRTGKDLIQLIEPDSFRASNNGLHQTTLSANHNKAPPSDDTHGISLQLNTHLNHCGDGKDDRKPISKAAGSRAFFDLFWLNQLKGNKTGQQV